MLSHLFVRQENHCLRWIKGQVFFFISIDRPHDLQKAHSSFCRRLHLFWLSHFRKQKEQQIPVTVTEPSLFRFLRKLREKDSANRQDGSTVCPPVIPCGLCKCFCKLLCFGPLQIPCHMCSGFSDFFQKVLVQKSMFQFFINQFFFFHNVYLIFQFQ